MSSMLDEFDDIPEEKHMDICRKADELQRIDLDEEDKVIAEKAAKLIARDYGETIKELGDA